MSAADELEKLAKLHQQGALNDAEFAQQKRAILAQNTRAAAPPRRRKVWPIILGVVLGVFFMIGLLAAIAIPSFIKYVRKSKTVEATEGLWKIQAGAKQYFQSDHYDTETGNLLPKAFPEGVGWTPATPCCQSQTGPKCMVDAKAWDHPTWRALSFQLSDPHYYQFRFTSSGTQTAATYTIEARGDLDCDGAYSSYKITAKVDSELGVVATGPLIEDEIE